MAYERCSLVVPSLEIAQATALLEHASGQHAAISQTRAHAVASVWVPASQASGAIRRVHRALRSVQRAGVLSAATFVSARVRDAAWASSWKRFYRPFRAAPRLWIAPTWEPRFRAPRGAALLRLDPGMAFGTGLHPTTQMALGLLMERVAAHDTVLDIGCGSGILGIAAAQRGAAVYASDVDGIAVRAARANFAANAVRARRIVRAADVPSTFPDAHIVVANITGRVLTRLAPQLTRALRPGGWLIASGVVASAKREVLAALRRAGFSRHATAEQGEWLAFAHRKPQR